MNIHQNQWPKTPAQTSNSPAWLWSLVHERFQGRRLQRSVTQDWSSGPIPSENWAADTETCFYQEWGCLFWSISLSWVLLAVGYRATAATRDTPVLWLETGTSFNKSYKLLVPSHNTPEPPKSVCWVTWEIGEGPFPGAAEEAEAPEEEKQRQKGSIATLESSENLCFRKGRVSLLKMSD